MKIGIDVSQMAYEKTGVSKYLLSLVRELVNNDEHEFILFFSSFRINFKFSPFDSAQGKIFNFQSNSNVKIFKYKFPPTFLDILWNKLHVWPIENFIGDVDVFITSDWTEPPTRKAKKATILYDLIIYKHPEETDKKIVETQKRKLSWVKKESDVVFCISEATKKDAEEILGIKSEKLKVIYPGLTI